MRHRGGGDHDRGPFGLPPRRGGAALTTSGYRWLCLLDLDARSRQDALEVYESGFPAALRAPFEEILGCRPDERAHCLVGAEGEVLGLCLVRDLGATSWSFLRYFVISAERRGGGLGGRLWAALAADLRRRDRSLLALDVEDPDDADAQPGEVVERRRRVAFYARCGAHLLPVEGYAPPEHGQPGASPPPLRLLAARLPPAGPGGPAGAELARLVEAVYEHRYGLAPGDPVVRATLARSGLAAGLPPGAAGAAD